MARAWTSCLAVVHSGPLSNREKERGVWSEAMYNFREAWMLTSRLTGWMVSLCRRTGWTNACTD